MSLFDDSNENGEEYYYEPDDEFQRQLLKNADELDEHPLALLAQRQSASLDAFEHFCRQDPKMSKKDFLAIKSDIKEARQGLKLAYMLVPAEITRRDDDGGGL